MSEEHQQRVTRIRADYPRAYERWTAEEDLVLVERAQAGWNTGQLAAHFQRQPSAIRSRLHKLALNETILSRPTEPGEESASERISTPLLR